MRRRLSRVEREIQQTKPFASTAVVPIVAVLRTANVLERHYTALLEPHGISFQQLNVLTILRGAEPEGHPTLEIRRRLIAATPGVTRLLDKLEDKKLVRRVAGDLDRRQVICRITPAGLALLAQIDPLLSSADDRLMAPLTESERRVLVDLLDRVRDPLIPVFTAAGARAGTKEGRAT